MPFERSTWVLLGALGSLFAVGGYLYLRDDDVSDRERIAPAAKAVTAVAAVSDAFQPTRRYVARVEPWVHAKVGPELVSAYVDTVLVRAGAIVKRGQVVATLDCRDASARSKQIAAQARALDATSTAAAKEAARFAQLSEGQYVSENEVEQKAASAASTQAQAAALTARMIGTSLRVDDCTLRAPFDGEVAQRRVDPGAFVSPGAEVVTMIDRHTVRIVADVPEQDFDAVAPGASVHVHLHATGQDFIAKISRRAPGASQTTRTTAIEIDVENQAQTIPVWTTADVSLDNGTPVPASALPLAAASVHAGKATVFVDHAGRAQQTRANVIGESVDTLYVDAATIAPGTAVVVDGHSLLVDGDAIAATTTSWHPGQVEAR